MDDIKENKFSEDILKNIRKTLETKGVTLDHDNFDDFDTLSNDLLIKLMDQPVDYIIKDNGELSVTVDSEEFILDPKRENAKDIASQEKKLINSLPEFNVDLYFNGMKRKQQEATAAYKLIAVSAALGGHYDEGITGIMKDYDYENLRPLETGGITFNEYLKIVEQDANSVIKFLLACCSIMFVSKKQTTEKPFIGILADEDAEWLRKIDETITLRESDVSKLLEIEPSRFERLRLINEKNKFIDKYIKEETINDLRKDVLFKIMRLTSDSLPSLDKIKVKEAVRYELGILMNEKKILDGDTYDKLFKKISRRAIRQAVRTMQKAKYLQIMDVNADLSKILPKI
jgi:hypothetical protein